MTAAELLAAVRTAQGIPSNYRLARVLNLPDSTLTRWNTGRHAPDEEMAVHLAELAGLDPEYVVAAMNAERTTNPASKALWTRIAARLKQGAGVAVAVILSAGVLASPDASATVKAPAFGMAVGGCLKIMSTTARALRSFLAGFAPPCLGGFAGLQM